MKLQQAINKYAAGCGDRITNRDYACKLWPEIDKESARVRLSRIMNKKAGLIPIDFVERVCKLSKITPNELFGYAKFK